LKPFKGSRFANGKAYRHRPLSRAAGRRFIVYDSEFLLVPLHLGQELYLELEDSAHGHLRRQTDPRRADVVRLLNSTSSRRRHSSPKRGGTLTRTSSTPSRFERQCHFMFFLVMFILSSSRLFGILNTLIPVTVQKTAMMIGIIWDTLEHHFFRQIAGVFLGAG